MNQRHLSYFLEVYEKKSISKAAEALYISPQGLSKTISALEEELGISLFIHKSNRIIPTEAAAKLAYHARNILNEYDIVKEKLFVRGDSKKVLRAACSYDAPKIIPTDFLAEYFKSYPEIRLSLMEYPDNIILQMLDNNEIELAILPGPLDVMKYDMIIIKTEPFCLMVNVEHELASADSVSMSELKDMPLAVKDMSNHVSICQYGEFIKSQSEPDIVFECSDCSLIKKLVEDNSAIGMILKSMTEDIDTEKIKVLPFREEWISKTMYLVRNRNTVLSYEAETFKKALTDYLQI